MPSASTSQYPVPLLTGAMSTVLDADWTWPATWPQDSVTSLGGAHELTKMAAMEPPAYPVGENAAPMERIGGPVGQSANWCKMMSRWPQHSDGVRRLHAELVVDEPPQPSSYIQ